MVRFPSETTIRGHGGNDPARIEEKIIYLERRRPYPIPQLFPFFSLILGEILSSQGGRPVPRSFTIAMTTLCAGTLRPRLIDYVLSVCLLGVLPSPFPLLPPPPDVARASYIIPSCVLPRGKGETPELENARRTRDRISLSLSPLLSFPLLWHGMALALTRERIRGKSCNERPPPPPPPTPPPSPL